MIEFDADYFDGTTSKAHTVRVQFDGICLHLHEEGSNLRLSIPRTDFSITPPLGRTRRVITLKDGGRCETDDDAALEDLERAGGMNRASRLVHLLETGWKWVALSTLVLVVAAWAFGSYGIPFLAKKAAPLIPTEVIRRVSGDGLSMLDRSYFAPSGVSPAKAEALRAVMAEVCGKLMAGGTCRLELRKGGKRIGANAFALPSGTVVMTDELVALAENDKELAAVLAHEVTHVRERHLVRQVLQTSGIFLLISTLTGDLSSITSVASSLPLILVQSGYSRRFEREADRGAVLYMMAKGWGISPYETILQRLSKAAGPEGNPSLLSTHPALADRLVYIRKVERRVAAKK